MTVHQPTICKVVMLDRWDNMTFQILSETMGFFLLHSEIKMKGYGFMSVRTIRNISEMDGRTYVYLANDEIGNKFMQMAEDEEFTFGDGVKPTERQYAEVMAVNHNSTINYVGANGRMAFGSGVKTIGDEVLIRIDFEKYLSGDESYLIDDTKRTIKNAVAGREKAYFYLEDEKTKKLFVESLVAEGCKFGNTPVTSDFKAESIMSVDKDMNVFFVGQAGSMIMKSKQVNDSMVKIDFSRYVSDKDNYLR